MKWFRVNRISSLIELKILGENISEEEIESAKIQNINKSKIKKELDLFLDSDENFSFIAGYTSGGIPYGTTWEEADYVKDDDSGDDNKKIDSNMLFPLRSKTI